jgi:AcrR family transcriptional regulator
MAVITATRRKQKEVTRQALAEAGLRCFSAAGYPGTSIAQITAEAGVAHGTFYVHFKSKEELLEELLHAYNARFVERLAPLIESGVTSRSPRELIREVARIFIEVWKAERSLITVYLQRAGVGLRLESLRDGVDPGVTRVAAGWIAAFARRYGTVLEDAELITQALFALWFRLGLQLLFGETVTQELVLDRLEALTFGALAAVIPGLNAA